mgnify:CR=1 FL=1
MFSCLLRSRHWLKSESGGALLEAALVLPMILVVIMGVARFGLTFNNYITLHNAVRSGTRELAISRAPGQNACTIGEARLRSAAPSLVQASLLVTPTVTTSCTELKIGSDATLTATYPCNLEILGINFAPNCVLTAKTTERVE